MKSLLKISNHANVCNFSAQCGVCAEMKSPEIVKYVFILTATSRITCFFKNVEKVSFLYIKTIYVFSTR